jgi:hypothetical protein
MLTFTAPPWYKEQRLPNQLLPPLAGGEGTRQECCLLYFHSLQWTELT